MKHETTTQPAHGLLNLGFNIWTTEEALGPWVQCHRIRVNHILWLPR